MNKEVRKLVTALQRIPDVEVTEGGSGHLVVSRGGQFVVSLSATPSDIRWKDNAMSALRRMGITPGTRPPKKRTGPPKIKQMDVRAELVPIREAKQLPQFARFAQQLGEIRGIRTFASVESAENTLRNVVAGSSMRSWGWELTMAALIEWRRRAPEPEPEARAVEPRRPVEQPSAGLRLVVNLDALAAKLAEFGIELEVQ